MSYRDVKNMQSILFCLLVFISGYVGAAMPGSKARSVSGPETGSEADTKTGPEVVSRFQGFKSRLGSFIPSKLQLTNLVRKMNPNMPDIGWKAPTVLGMGILAFFEYQKYQRQAAINKSDKRWADAKKRSWADWRAATRERAARLERAAGIERAIADFLRQARARVSVIEN